jgi:cell division protein FtsA
MNNKNFEVYFDCGSSKIRAAAFNKNDPQNNFYKESNFFTNYDNIENNFEKIISALEIDTKEYLDDVNLMIDSSAILSIGISVTKKFDGSKLKKEDVQFLIQDAKQQILRNYYDKNIIHIIIKKYTIDNKDYTFLPDHINCKSISLDIFFICLPKKTIAYFKDIFSKLDISVSQIFCTSYAKSINYKKNFSKTECISFIDVGFNKTSITCYHKNEIIFLNILPIGGNHITKDISKILKIDFYEAENLKIDLNYIKNLDEKKISLDLMEKVIFARTEEILNLCLKSIKLNLNNTLLNKCKMVLTGGGSIILNKEFKEKISLLTTGIDLLEETTENICESGLKLIEGQNKQEVVIVPKKQIKQGFFERLFHFFR